MFERVFHRFDLYVFVLQFISIVLQRDANLQSKCSGVFKLCSKFPWEIKQLWECYFVCIWKHMIMMMKYSLYFASHATLKPLWKSDACPQTSWSLLTLALAVELCCTWMRREKHHTLVLYIHHVELIQLWFVLDSFWLLISYIWLRISVMMFDTHGCFFAQKEASLFKHVELDLSIWALNRWHRRFIRDSRISHHRSALFDTSKLTSNSFESEETEQQPLDSKHRMNRIRSMAFWEKISFCFISQQHKWVLHKNHIKKCNK